MAPPARTATQLASDKELSDFLKSVEKRAFKRTVYTVRSDDAALDIVQDAMIRLAEKYADRPAAELPLLFQRILSNATMDWFRREKVRSAVMQNVGDLEAASGNDEIDLFELLEGVEGQLGTESAADALSRTQVLLAIEAAVSELPVRQREAFLLRQWAARRAASRRIVLAPCTRWPRPFAARESHHDHTALPHRPRPASGPLGRHAGRRAGRAGGDAGPGRR